MTSTTNGETCHSHFITHLTSYPLVSDGITSYKSHPYGQKSLSLFHDAYSRYAVPWLPYLSRPYSYVAPYVAAADSLGNSGLSKVDDCFPIVKEDTATIRGAVCEYAAKPVTVAKDGKEYVCNVYGAVSSETDGQGLPKLVKSVVLTGIGVATDALAHVAAWLGPKREKTE